MRKGQVPMKSNAAVPEGAQVLQRRLPGKGCEGPLPLPLHVLSHLGCLPAHFSFVLHQGALITCCSLILHFSGSRTVSKRPLFFISHPGSGTLLAQQKMDQDQHRSSGGKDTRAHGETQLIMRLLHLGTEKRCPIWIPESDQGKLIRVPLRCLGVRERFSNVPILILR